MMTLREARCAFSACFAQLVLYGVAIGYEVGIDETTERLTAKDPTSDHRQNSLHHLGLAGDLNLYRGGQWLSRTEDHEELGDFWEKMGEAKGLPLTWGGQWGDGGHYSLAWGGRK